MRICLYTFVEVNCVWDQPISWGRICTKHEKLTGLIPDQKEVQDDHLLQGCLAVVPGICILLQEADGGDAPQVETYYLTS